MKLELKEIGWESIDWIRVAQDSDKWWVILIVPINVWVL
jgi:hypothetical protein